MKVGAKVEVEGRRGVVIWHSVANGIVRVRFDAGGTVYVAVYHATVVS